MQLFVPGRICLFGEHSDWAASHRRVNSRISKGYTIICGTNQGLYADVRKNDTSIVFRRIAPDGTLERMDLPLDASELKRIAEEGGFWSYIAGVAYQIHTHYHVGGVEIDNFRTDLPMKKGLSSSAAVCVLVARAYNRLYDLKMSTRGEMDMAYRGEITTPSRCGRMDQGCAYGSRPILMTFDGDAIDVQELRVGRDFYYVIADLHSHKDTIKILQDLNRAYPFADSPTARDVQEYLGSVNQDIVTRAIDSLEKGDASTLGGLMNEAQTRFDAAMIPACPDELTAPVLHGILTHTAIKKLVIGGKGVGSQGDGSVQLLARDAVAQEKLMEVLNGPLGLSAYPLTIRKTKTIKRAVITAAGFGTRLFPFTKVIRKEFLPVVDESGLSKPLIMKHVEDLVNAGIERVGIVIQREEQQIFDRLFKQQVSPELFNRLPTDKRSAAVLLEQIGQSVEYIYQDRQGGLGDAVLRGSEWAKGEGFLLVLGDHVFTPTAGTEACISQIITVHEDLGRPVIGLARTPLKEVERFGCVTGEWEAEGKILSIGILKEKPTMDFADENLHVPGFPRDEYLSVFGLYVIDPAMTAVLNRMADHEELSKGELQLTDALEAYRRENGLLGVLLSGSKEDVGSPLNLQR